MPTRYVKKNGEVRNYYQHTKLTPEERSARLRARTVFRAPLKSPWRIFKMAEAIKTHNKELLHHVYDFVSNILKDHDIKFEGRLAGEKATRPKPQEAAPEPTPEPAPEPVQEVEA